MNDLSATSAPTPPRVTPTVSQSVRVDWGSWLAQALEHSEDIISHTAAGAAGLALRSVPMGAIVSAFIGPRVIEQYVKSLLDTLEGVLSPMGTDIPGSSPWLVAVANVVNKNEPGLAAWLGDELEPMIKAALAKFGIAA